MKKSVYYFILFSILFVNCKKDDNPTVDTVDLDSEIELNDEDVSYNLASLKWSAVAGTTGETIVYDLYLEGEKIKDSNTDLDYTFTGLISDTEYSGRIVPKTQIANKSGTTGRNAKDLSPISFAFKTKAFANPDAPTPEFEFNEVSNITANEATLEWSTATISDETEITYSIYLEGDLMANSLTSNVFTFENLNPKTTYKGVILAFSSNLKSTAVKFEFTTLAVSDEVALTSFEFYRGASASFADSEFIQLIPIVTPANATAVDLIWTSSDESIVRIQNQYGYINTFGLGKTIITATSADDPTISKSIEVTVTPRRPTESPYVVMSPLRSSLVIGDTKLMAISKRNIEIGSSDDSFTITSSDPSIATIDQEGNVTGVAEGTVALTVRSTVDASITRSAMLRVVTKPIPVTAITIWGGTEDRTVYRNPNQGSGGGIIVEPEDATDKTVLFTSTNTDVINVVGSSIYPVGVGEASLIITSASNSAVSQTIKYIVLENPTSYDETTGIYTALPGSTANLVINGDAFISEGSNTGVDPIIEGTVFFSVKNANGDELIEVPFSSFFSEGFENPDGSISISFFTTASNDFIMPDDGEVVIEISIQYNSYPAEASAPFVNLAIGNTEGLVVNSQLNQ